MEDQSLQRQEETLSFSWTARVAELERQEHLRFLVQNTPNPVLVLGEAGEILYTSPTFERVFGYSREDVLGEAFYGFLHEEDRKRLPERVDALPDFRRRGDPAWQVRFRRHDGTWQWLSGTATDLRDDPRIRGLLVHLRPARAGLPLDAGWKLLKEAVQAANSSITISDPTLEDHPIVFANQGFLDLTGYPEEEVLGRNCRFLQFRQDGTRDEAQEDLERLRRAVEAGEFARVVLRNYRRDGTMFWNELYLTPVRDEQGRLTHFIGVQNDVTLEKEREDTLVSFYNSAPMLMGVVERHPDGSLVHVTDNRAAADFFGLSQEAMQGRTGVALGFTEACEAQWSEAYAESERTRGMVRFACTYLRHDDLRHLHVTVNYIGRTPAGAARFSYIAADVTEEQQHEAERRLLEVAVEQADESLFIMEANLDAPGPRFIYVNPAFTRLTGYAQEDVIGKTPRILQGPETDPAVLKRLRQDLKERQHFRGETVNYRKDGTPYIVEWHIAPIRDEHGEVTHWVATQRDMTRRRAAEEEVRRLNAELEARVQERTAALELKNAQLEAEIAERKQAEAELQVAKETAERADMAKTAFLANMSHEIRTPLTAILGFASLLVRQVTGRHRRYAERIESAGSRLMDTLNLVLDLARLDAGRFEVNLEHLHVSREVRDVVNLFKARAAQKGLKLGFRVVTGAEEARAVLDRGALSSILTNLIGNAIKFTEAGRVEVTVDVCRRHDDPVSAVGVAEAERVRVRVADTGIGISRQFLPQLFEEFMQESSGTTRLHEGSGLGLAITRRLVHLMGGDISVDSEKGRGSVFSISFALAQEEPAASPEPAAEPAAEAQRPQVLLVEDNRDTQFLMQSLLEDLYDVTLAASAVEAMEAARRVSFDLILLDINLGESDSGLDVLHELRGMPTYRRVPIVAITAYALPGDRDRFLEAGFTSYLSKPFKVDELLRMIEELLPA